MAKRLSIVGAVLTLLAALNYLAPPAAAAPTCLGQTPTITATGSNPQNGTPGNDVILIDVDSSQVPVSTFPDDPTPTTREPQAPPSYLVGILKIDAGGGNDVICVQTSGSHKLRLSILGGPGDDTIRTRESTSAHTILMFGGDGKDNLGFNKEARGGYANGGNDRDMIFGGPGNDQLIGGEGNDHIWGYDGDDLLDGRGGDDYLYGMNGDDRIFGDAGSDYLHGGNGTDYGRTNSSVYKVFSIEWLDGPRPTEDKPKYKFPADARTTFSNGCYISATGRYKCL